MDRTAWHYGETPLNILVLGVALGGVVLPIVWTVLPHQGNSHTGARVLLVSKLLQVLPTKRWAVLVAERRESVLTGAVLPKKEFIEEDWCNLLRWKRICMCLRIKENTHTLDGLAHDQFLDLKPGEVRTLFERTWLYGVDAGGGHPVSCGRQGDCRFGFTHLGCASDLPEALGN